MKINYIFNYTSLYIIISEFDKIFGIIVLYSLLQKFIKGVFI